MDLLLKHQQIKKTKRNGTTSTCQFQLHEFNDLIHLLSDFTFDYFKYETKTRLSIHHGLTINLKTGDIHTYYQLHNFSLFEGVVLRSKNTRKKNDFKTLHSLIVNSIYRGEKGKGYWGVKYEKSIKKLIDILTQKIKPHISTEYHQNKDHNLKSTVNPLFGLLVDFHLEKKKIKPHDSVYYTIQQDYPKLKWLRQNENKFLPAVLDSYGIKSKYLISEINTRPESEIQIRTLNYFCKLFGDDFVNYLRKINWLDLVTQCIGNGKTNHMLKNEVEKKSMVKLINDWDINKVSISIRLDTIIELLTIREFLEKKGIILKFDASTISDVEILLNKWKNLKNYFKKGYKVKYTFPENFINVIEEEIIVENKVFNVKILKTEEDFFTEGFIMKNCIGKQFNRGAIFIFISMNYNKTRINLEYKNGNLITSLGKANTKVEPIFEDAVNTLTKRMSTHYNVNWFREKYDCVKK